MFVWVPNIENKTFNRYEEKIPTKLRILLNPPYVQYLKWKCFNTYLLHLAVKTLLDQSCFSRFFLPNKVICNLKNKDQSSLYAWSLSLSSLPGTNLLHIQLISSSSLAVLSSITVTGSFSSSPRWTVAKCLRKENPV